MYLSENEYKYKMIIELDKRKIKSDSRYSYDDLKYAITKTCDSINIVKKDEFYVCNEYESVLAILNSISHRKWLYNYISRWDLYDSEGHIESLLE